MNSKPKTEEVIKKRREDFNCVHFSARQTLIPCCGHTTCALWSSELKFQLSSLMQHLQRNKAECLLVADIKEKQRSRCWSCTFAEHVMLCFVSSTVSAWHEIRWGWLCVSVKKCVAAVYGWDDSGKVSNDWHCIAMMHSSVGTVHKPDQG